MTVPESTKQAIRNWGPAPEGDNGAPNGYNPHWGDEPDQADCTDNRGLRVQRLYRSRPRLAGRGGRRLGEIQTLEPTFLERYRRERRRDGDRDQDGNRRRRKSGVRDETVRQPNGPAGIGVESAELSDRTAHAGGDL